MRLPAQVASGVLLTAVAGFVDAVGSMSLGGLFASFMSGASVSLGGGLGDGRWDPVYQGALMIAAFLGGVTLGTVLTGVARIWALSALLFLEALFLAGAVFLAQSGWSASTVILPVVTAMGLQNTALQPVNGVRLGVTFITGTLVSLGRSIGQALLGQAEPWRLGGHALTWSALVAGAVAGVILHGKIGSLALAVPATLVAGLAMLSALAGRINSGR